MKTIIEVKRTLEALKLTRSPLIFVLAQVRITPVMKMESFVPDIQDKLRRMGYPKMRKRVIRTETLDAQGNALQVEEQLDWEFMSKDDQCALIVGTHSLALITSNYTHFEKFAHDLEDCLRVVDEVISIGGVERIGLRYMDLIEPTDEKPLSYFLSPHILGLDLTELGTRVANKSETVLETGLHQRLVVRCFERPKGLVMPPDLLPTSLKSKLELKLDRSFGILDSDHYLEFPSEPMNFQLEDVVTKLADLHDVLDRAFRKAVNPDIIEREWK